MEQTELQLSDLDVEAIAAAAAKANPQLSINDILETFGALLTPEPALYARSVISAALRLFTRYEERFTHYLPDDAERHLAALQAAVDALDTGDWGNRPHLLQPPPKDKNPFIRHCVGVAPLYSAVGLASASHPEAFAHILVEAIAAGMAYIQHTRTPQQYLDSLRSEDLPTPLDASRLQGGERALRWLSDYTPADFLLELGDGLEIGTLAERLVVHPPLALDEARTRLDHKHAARIAELERYLKLVALDAAPSLRLAGSRGAGLASEGGAYNKGRYEFIDPQFAAIGGRDIVDDNPELPAHIINIGQPPQDLAGEEAQVEGLPPNQFAVLQPESDERPLDAQIMAAKQKAALIERGNQALPFAWGVSTRLEIDTYVDLASKSGTELTPASWHAAICALLATGCTVEALSEIRWASGREQWRSDIEYDLSRKEWRIPTNTPAFKSALLDTSPSAAHRPSIHVRLPDYWRFWRFFKGDGTELSRRQLVFKTGATKLRSEARAGFALYTSQGLRLSLERCANVLAQTLYQQTQDVGPLSNFISDSSWHSATVGHYQTTPVSMIQRCYRLAQHTIAPKQVSEWDKLRAEADQSLPGDVVPALTPSGGEYCGAAHHPVVPDLAARIASMKVSLEIREVEEPADSRIEFHNRFVQYVAGWQMFETAMRAIRDPSPVLIDGIVNHPSNVDEGDQEHWIAYISDKQRGTRYLDRLACLSADLISQLEEWERHARQIGYLVRAAGFDAPSHVFYVLAPDGTPSELTPTHFSESGFQFPYRVNAFRRLVRSHLSTNGVNGEIIDAYLGHGRRGTERWNRFSTLSMKDVADEVRPHLSSLRTQLGWSLVRSPYAR